MSHCNIESSAAPAAEGAEHNGKGEGRPRINAAKGDADRSVVEGGAEPPGQEQDMGEDPTAVGGEAPVFTRLESRGATRR